MMMNFYSRINIVGTSGSGKTTFAKSLAQILTYEYIEMDQLFWGPNWNCPSDEEYGGIGLMVINIGL